MGMKLAGQVALVVVFAGCADAGGGDSAPECNGLDVIFEGCSLPQAQPLQVDPDWTPDPAAHGGVWGNLPTLCDPSPDGAPCCGFAFPTLKCWDGVAVARCGDGDWVLADDFDTAQCFQSEPIYASCITDSWPSGQGVAVASDGTISLGWVGPGVIAKADCRPGDLYPRQGYLQPWEPDDQTGPFGVVQDVDLIHTRVCWDPGTGEVGCR